MNQSLSFGELLDAAERLPLEERYALFDVLKRRLALEERQRIAADIQESRRESEEGKAVPATPDEIMREILS
jgi:hypothetical protein